MTGGKKNTPDSTLGTDEELENQTRIANPESDSNIPSPIVVAQDAEDISLPSILGDLINKERAAYVRAPLKRVNNPGGGNCAFYAFAIALIEVIKKERAANNNLRSPMFERWIALDPSLANDYYAICAFDLNNPNRQKALLDRMQQGLRRITYQYKLAELSKTCAQARVEDGYNKLVGTSSFNNFSFLFIGLAIDNDANYNEFRDRGIIAQIKKTVPTLRRISLDHALAKKELNQRELKKAVGQRTLQSFLEHTLNIADVEQQQTWDILNEAGDLIQPRALERLKTHISTLAQEEREALQKQVVTTLYSGIFAQLKAQMLTLLPDQTVLGGELRIQIEYLLLNGALAAEINKHLLRDISEEERILAEDFQRKIGDVHYKAFSEAIKRQVLALSQDDDHLAEAMRQNLESRRYEAVSAEIKKHVLEVLQEEPTLLVECYENYTLVPIFLRLFYGADVDLNTTTEATPIARDSIVSTAMQRIMQDRLWGTHLDLDYLSYPFNVNLHTLENYQQKYVFRDLPGRPVLTLNNEGNGHWTTFIAAPPQPVAHLKTDTKVIKQPDAKIELVVDAEVEPKIKPKAESKTESKPITFSPSKPVSRKKLFKEINDTESLLRLVGDAVIRYCDYSDNISFSIFHRHGGTGRRRAQDFIANLHKDKNFNEVKTRLIDYLEDDKNGNTHPHSFRTMLLHELINANVNCTLVETSKNYEWQLGQLKKQMSMEERTAATIGSTL
ncbi:hypothetical protein ACD661_00180 [Legionella lytica]|uniref:Dot/Icm T4SS effector n=1 Tax=Legionella lytica TaxID=96232 RepID=A0ABW8D633_9GAMM